MPKKINLSDSKRELIARRYESGKWTQQQLAEHYNVSRRFIYSVLVAQGALPPRKHLTHAEARLLKVAKYFKMTDKKLQKVLEKHTGNVYVGT